MNIESVKLVCFSPTGTTRSVIQSIARGIGEYPIELLDITTPEKRMHKLITSEKELLIIGVPVYMGRVPDLITDWLNNIKGQNTPAVCVVVYGNRTYEDALLELSNILTNCGCKTIAGAAYVGEHSFSSDEFPTAKNRPDFNDLHHAELLGSAINEKLLSAAGPDEIPQAEIPGIFPYRGNPALWSVDFVEVNDDCMQCGLCAAVCPAGAVDSENSRLIDKEKCITCCACIKNCPQNARSMKEGPVKEAAARLNRLYNERKEPVFFLS